MARYNVTVHFVVEAPDKEEALDTIDYAIYDALQDYEGQILEACVDYAKKSKD